MEGTAMDVKYNKLASGYSKVRGQLTVLKQALLDEQSKSSALRETLRQKDTAVRRAEQEVDSLGFRNKQLEHRVASLQEDLNRETKSIGGKQHGKSKIKTSNEHSGPLIASDPIFTEELQKKILENAQLASLVADKNSDIELYTTRISDLEKLLSKITNDNQEVERKLRKEIESLSIRNSTLEAKLAEGVSIVGSEDALSCSENDHTPIHRNSTTSDERIAQLEKDLFHWKTKYEICKITNQNSDDGNCSSSSSIDKRLLTNGPSSSKNDTFGSGDSEKIEEYLEPLSKEQLIYNHFMKKLDAIFAEKYQAESKLASYMIECESIHNNLEILSDELSNKEEKYIECQNNWQRTDEDLATTRINYEEQISVLTEQVISLSDQLAALK